MGQLLESKISFYEVLEFWKSFLPESVDDKKVIKEIEMVMGCNIDAIMAEYIPEKSENYAQYFDASNFWNEEEYSFYLNCNKWFAFYAPILFSGHKELCEYLENINIIADKKILIQSIVKQILQRCNEISFRTMVLETNIAKEDGKLYGNTPQEKGKYYSEKMLTNKGYLSELYEIYPELIRSIKLQIENKIAFVKEVILNTIDNYDMIQKRFGCIGLLVDISMGKGDTHNDGKMVCKLVFEKKELIYKPRILEMENRYFSLIRWINDQNIDGFMKLRACKCLNGKNDAVCGWMEFVSYKSCTRVEEIQNFYTRIGELLCLLHVLNGKDMHYENVIASGEQPILIDLETLLHPEMLMEKSKREQLENKLSQEILNSVNSIALLPTYITGKDKNKAINIGGVSQGEIHQTAPFKELYINNFDSDDICVSYEYGIIASANNNPSINEEIADSKNYVSNIKRGFNVTYQWLQYNKETFMDFFKINFGKQQIRHILRPTNLYARLLNISYHPDLLHNFIDRRVFLLWLRFQLEEELREEDRSALIEEYKSLLNGDIPYFYTYTDSRSLFCRNGKEIKNYFEKTIYKSIEEKIMNIGTDDLRRQIAFINSAYRLVDAKSHLTKTVFQTNSKDELDYISLKEQFLNEAINIGKLIIKKGIYGKTASNKRAISWLGISTTQSKVDMMGPVGNDLYDGNAGIAIFFAVLASQTGMSEFKEMAYLTIVPIREKLENFNEYTSEKKMGAFIGAFGWLYSMQKVADIFNDVEMQAFVEEKLMYIIPMLSEISCDADVIGGYAGILSLVLFWNKRGVIEKKDFEKLSNYLLQQIMNSMMTDELSGGYMWEGKYSGYAHGNAGIIGQLVKLYSYTQNKYILKVIEKGLIFERSLFDTNKQMWLRRQGSNEIQYTWCNGATGILLSRIELLKNGYVDEYINREIEFLISECKKYSMGKGMCLCHGDVGNILILKYVANYFENHTLENECISTMQYFVKNSLNLIQLEEEEEWGLLTGAAGIGLGLLSVIDSDYVMDILELK